MRGCRCPFPMDGLGKRLRRNVSRFAANRYAVRNSCGVRWTRGGGMGRPFVFPACWMWKRKKMKDVCWRGFGGIKESPPRRKKRRPFSCASRKNNAPRQPGGPSSWGSVPPVCSRRWRFRRRAARPSSSSEGRTWMRVTRRLHGFGREGRWMRIRTCSSARAARVRFPTAN